MKTQLRAFFLVFVISVIFAATGFSQQRYCDMDVTLTSPTENQFIAPFTYFDIKISIKNLGPDNLVAGDTVYYNTSMEFSQTYHPIVLTQAIDQGDSMEFLLDNVPNNNENPADEDAAFCVKIKTIDLGVTPLDTLTLNNISCNTITFSGIDPPSGIAKLKDNSNGFALFPNPVKNQLHLLINPLRFNSASITIYDGIGRILKTWKWDGAEQSVIDLSSFKPGIYFLSLKNKNQSSFLKFVKQ